MDRANPPEERIGQMATELALSEEAALAAFFDVPAETISLEPKSREEILANIADFDLDADIIGKVMQEQSWSPEEGKLWQREYKRFLRLSIMYPEYSIDFPKEVDKVWHGHVLDTPRYIRDCFKLFGFYFHHVPSYGRERPENRRAPDYLYEEEFGEPPMPSSFECGAGCDCRGISNRIKRTTD